MQMRRDLRKRFRDTHEVTINLDGKGASTSLEGIGQIFVKQACTAGHRWVLKECTQKRRFNRKVQHIHAVHASTPCASPVLKPRA